LLVIDNLDDITLTDYFVPRRQSQGHILVTTRNPHSEEIPADGYQVPSMTPEESADLFFSKSTMNHFGEDSHDVVQRIVRALSYHPLAIEQTAARPDVAQFLVSFESKKKGFLSSDLIRTVASPENIVVTKILSLESLSEDSVHLLELFTYLDPEGIRLDYLQDGKKGLPGELRNVFENDIRLLDCLTALERCSLVKVSRNKDVVMIHPLVQTMIRERPHTRKADNIKSVVESALEGFPDSENIPLCRRYRNQALRAMDYWDEYLGSLEDVRPPVSMHRICEYLHHDGYTHTASALLNRLLEAQMQTLPHEDPDIIQTMHLLAIMLSELGRNDEAVEMQKKVLETRKRSLGGEHPDTLHSLHHLAVAYTHAGRYVEAVGLFEQILNIQTKSLPSGTVEVPLSKEGMAILRSKEGMAMACSGLGLAEGATHSLRQILETRRVALGAEHTETLSGMHNLAVAYVHLERYVEAAELEEVVLSVRRRVLGFEHPETLRSMKYLASLNSGLGREQEALDMMEKTAALIQRIVTKDPDAVLSKEVREGLQAKDVGISRANLINHSRGSYRKFATRIGTDGELEYLIKARKPSEH